MNNDGLKFMTSKPRTPFTQRVVALISDIPTGRVCTYGALAAAAGSPRGARQVARILHSCSTSDGLPWHRVVGKGGRILLPGAGGSLQKQLLEMEGVMVSGTGVVDLPVYLWLP